MRFILSHFHGYSFSVSTMEYPGRNAGEQYLTGIDGLYLGNI